MRGQSWQCPRIVHAPEGTRPRLCGKILNHAVLVLPGSKGPVW